MAEIRVGKNETLDSALRRFKRSCQRLVFFPKFGNVNTTKNRVYGERKSPKQHGNGSTEHNR